MGSFIRFSEMLVPNRYEGKPTPYLKWMKAFKTHLNFKLEQERKSNKSKCFILFICKKRNLVTTRNYIPSIFILFSGVFLILLLPVRIK